MKPIISVIIHTHNSEKTLERALKSVQKLADQLIVMDMESNDDSISIAKKYDAEIHSVKNFGYVEPVRNIAIGKAKGDWIFILDADEWIEQDLEDTLRSLSETTSASTAAFQLPRVNYIFGEAAGTGWWPDYNLRFFRSGACKWSDKIHSQPEVRGQILQLPATLENAIRHENYTSVSQFVERMNRYTSLESTKNHASPIHAFMDEFLQRYVVMRGYKDGVYGESLSVLQGMYAALASMKHIEKEGFSKKSQNASKLRYVSRIASYWANTLELQHSDSFVQKFFLRIRRKIGL